MRKKPPRALPSLLLLALGALLAAGCASLPEQPVHGGFHDRAVIVDGVRRPYQVFEPGRAAASGPPPVILFLHGSGERGGDGRKPTLVGLGPYLRTHADAFPALVVFPQAPEGSEWSDAAGIALAALEAATREFGGDPSRTWLTGLSMGGYGAWELALAHPQRFAAMVPVCGGITAPAHRPSLYVTAVAGEDDPFMATARRLREMPVWIFHGARDDLVPPEQSRRMAAALEAAGATDARYTEFPDANHNSWDPAYATPALWEWLLSL